MEPVIPYVIPISSQKPKIISLVPADPGSRYKCRQLQVQVIGKSKMIRTVLVNILDVAKDMQVPPSYPGNYMGYEIGAQAKFDAKKPERQQAFLSGEHDPKDLSRIAQKFITEVVLCPQCGLPEVQIECAGKKILGVCRACGGREELRITNEKFRRFVLNHPPTASKGAFGGKQDVKKAEAKEKKTALKERSRTKPEEEEGEEEGPEEDGEKVVWYTDTSSEAARRRREEMLPDSLRTPKKQLDPSEVRGWITQGEWDRIEEERKTSDSSTFVATLFRALQEEVVGALVAQKPLPESATTAFSKFVTNGETQTALVEALEEYCLAHVDVLTQLPLLLKQLYDADIVTEEVLLEWAENPSGSQSAREHAAPFIQWLQEAEEESDSEDEEEDD